MCRANVKRDVMRGLHIFDSKRKDDRISAGGAFHFTHHLTRFVRLTAQEKDKDLAFVDGIDNSCSIIFSRRNVPGGHPAADTILLEIGADTFRDLSVRRRMADEYDSFHQAGFEGLTISQSE